MKTIVILGAGMAAAPLIRQLMRNLVLPSGSEWKMVVVAPNTHYQLPIPMVRVIVPGAMSEDKAFVPLSKQFDEYSADKFEFVLGTAERLDPKGKSVSVRKNGGGVERTVLYDALVIATGASARDDVPWKTLGDTPTTLNKLHELHSSITKASSIVVAGGGATGTETTAELAFEYARSGSAQTKEITLIHQGELPLAGLIPGAQRQAKIELQRLNVKLIPHTNVSGASKGADGKTTLHLKDDKGQTTSLITDVYIPATGVVPNTSFVPKDMLTSTGYIKQTPTLQAESHPDIFVAGDAGYLEANKAQMADQQAVHLIRALPGHLLRGEALAEKALDNKDAVAVTLGRSKGTGQVMGWKLPSFLVWLTKGRGLFAEGVVEMAMGKKTTSTTFEK